MKTRFLFCFLLMALSLRASARLVKPWSEDKLENASYLIVVAIPIATRDLVEENSLGWEATIGGEGIKFRSVETTFKVLNVLKAMPVNDRIVLHHYRIEKAAPPNGPIFITFIPGSTNQWVLYLKKDGVDRYAPVAGQIDPGLSIRPFTGHERRIGFPLIPPKADADPAIQHSTFVQVPARG